MDDTAPPDPEARSALFGTLLSRHPDASVLAVTIDGRPLPWPASIPLGDHVVDDLSLFEMIAEHDHSQAVAAFQSAIVHGVGRVAAHLAADPRRWVEVHYVDLRAEHGIFARLIAPTAAPEAPVDTAAPAPRVGVVQQNALGEIVMCDDAYASLWGGDAKDLVGRSVLDLIHPDDHHIAIEAWIAMHASSNAQRFRYRAIRADGTLAWREATVRNRLDEPDVEAVIAETIDISDEVAAHEALRAHELRLERIARLVPVGLFEIDTDCRVLYANDRLHEVMGSKVGGSLDDVLTAVPPEDRARVDEAFAAALAGRTDVDIDVEVAITPSTTTGGRRVRMSIRPATDALERVSGAIVCVADTTDATQRRRQLERDLIRHAFHDSLTGLANRALLINRADDAMGRYGESGLPVAVLLADIDGFKALNDSLGHGVGDELLRQVSDRLRALLQPGDTVARVGGDEFVVLLEGFLDPDRPRRIAEVMLSALALPFAIEGSTLQISASIGVATTTTAHNTEELLRHADLAMYRARSSGRGRYEQFAQEMHAAVLARADLEASLRRAIDDGQLAVFYQPIHELRTRRVTSVEALVRWHHPIRGLVPPVEFIPLAEETGLIAPIGRWVLEQSCLEAASWLQLLGEAAPRISVNLSARQLVEDGFIEEVHHALERAGLDPGRLILEITESVLVDTTDRGLDVLDRLHGLGVQLAIDDFGTGYSSLAYLQRLPFDVLKIDRGFVSPLGEGGRHSALIDGIIGLARALGLRPVAEGIETAEQLRALSALGCGDGQGYLFSRPVDHTTIRHYLYDQLRHQPFDPFEGDADLRATAASTTGERGAR